MPITEITEPAPWYPPEDCTGQDSCKACRSAGFTFRCTSCRRTKPYCVGAHDAHPDWCNACWNTYHRTDRRHQIYKAT